MVKTRKPVKVSDAKKKRHIEQEQQRIHEKIRPLKEIQISENLEENLKQIRKILGESGDLVIRDFQLSGKSFMRAAVVFIDGLINSAMIDNFILRSLMFQTRAEPDVQELRDSLIDILKSTGLTINEIGEAEDFQKVVRSILSGDFALFMDGSQQALLMNTKGWERRGVQEPQTESVIRGPRDGFTETLRVNTALVRIHLKDPDLRVKQLTVGERTNTDVALLYIDGIVDQKVLSEVEKRIHDMEIDGTLESGYVEQFIEDNHWSPFPQIQNTERPDKAAANLLEGKVVVVVDGTPFVLIAPAVFTQFYQSPEDYYERFLISTLIRSIRFISMVFALLLPSLYIAFSSFHPEMLPSKLAIAMAAGRSTVPFPAIIEAIIMEVSIEILREASVRLPGPIGPTIGIVGALVIGQSAVEAGLVSPILVIIVGLTTIGSFASPSYSAAIAFRMLRFPMMIFAAIFGLYGVMIFVIAVVIHLGSLTSFGVPYMAPYSPSRMSDLKDTVVRAPLYRMKLRPKMLRPADEKRVQPESAEGEGDKP